MELKISDVSISCCIYVWQGANCKRNNNDLVFLFVCLLVLIFDLRSLCLLGIKFGTAHRDGVDVAGVSTEGLFAGTFPHVPQLGQRVAGSRDESIHVWRQSQGHAVSNVVSEDNLLLASLEVPQAAGQQREEENWAWVNPDCEKKFNHPYIDTYMAVFSERTHQVVSPEAVRISVSLMNRQQDRYPVGS